MEVFVFSCSPLLPIWNVYDVLFPVALNGPLIGRMALRLCSLLSRLRGGDLNRMPESEQTLGLGYFIASIGHVIAVWGWSMVSATPPSRYQHAAGPSLRHGFTRSAARRHIRYPNMPVAGSRDSLPPPTPPAIKCFVKLILQFIYV